MELKCHYKPAHILVYILLKQGKICNWIRNPDYTYYLCMG